jgi:hypothetical protein
MLLKTDQIAGTDVEFHVGTHGRFTVKTPGDNSVTLGDGDTIEQATGKARVTLAKRKVCVGVPFRTLDGEHGQATGLHAGTGRVLARLDGESVQMDHTSLGKVLRADTPSEKIDRYVALADTIRDAQAEQRTIQREYHFDLDAAVKSAVAAAVAAKAAAA